MKQFALIGAAGYIAPRHMEAIKKNHCELTTAYDINDSVGIIDSFFPNARFFNEFELFDRHIDHLSRTGNKIDYISVCSPNYLHDAHIRYALRSGTHVICEKPLVLEVDKLDSLVAMENATGKKVNTVLQLRLHPAIINLKNKVDKEPNDKKHDVDLTYITARGDWYQTSWKGDINKSGGVAANIGVHFFDMLHFVFGELIENNVHHFSKTRSSGYLEYQKARVRWFLSIDANDLPDCAIEKGERTYRSITVQNKEIEFSGGFNDLHNICYQQILEGRGCGVEQARCSIQALSEIRRKTPTGYTSDSHPFLRALRSL
ncbi:Gfo/Idh/MocA family oxidoreductase [Marinibactrum halimedae]|uniref:Oxidoreductase n=1 Tax=Marinibactrum halimedae TaxID=1444977 RepID=A0AA37TA94_9GAMM|nr:Gfo/Idh/MocA family oxidoreductase [Marinibactrum halimedae]MCD9458035.1 Gfo/Idh/MocA family oxidoreductase [Marinibactrum halimedae]GLS27662.1 oxidoreductase [Marinibactrum halimedae]